MTMLEAALAYARHGWPVFPCHPETKRPLTPKGEDGAGGLKVATTDERVINTWWKRFPKAMIGIPTGASIGAFVLDLDAGVDEKTGEVFEVADLERALEAGVVLPPTWAAETPRGGKHLFFALADGEMPGNRAGLIRRVDVRGDGGYVIVPPSSRADGRQYRWIASPW
jgi:putative DNA primase/helicase